MSELQQSSSKQSYSQEQESLITQVISQTTVLDDSADQSAARAEIDTFVARVLAGQVKISGRIERALREYIEELDRRISAQVSAILHHPKFQRLEATWRGLSYLVRNTEVTKDITIRVFNATKDELRDDLLNAKAFDQSLIYKKAFERVYEQAGGEPYAALVGDYEFDNSATDIETLREMAKVASLGHAPFLSAASARMFSLNSFTELPDKHMDLGVLFNKPSYTEWKSFRDMDESRYVGLVAPHILMRAPYTSENYRASFVFEEDVDGRDHNRYLWGNAAYALAARLTDAFFQHGWTAAIIGEESGGRVSNLPLHRFMTDAGAQEIKCPTETFISDPRWAEMADQGFIPLVAKQGTDYATFYTAPSCQLPAVYDLANASANARLSASLPYIFAASRFAHYLKVITRTKLGSFMTRQNVEDYLNRWIKNYVVGNETADQEIKAKYPLQDARVDVVEVAGKPGFYEAKVYLKPHLHLEGLKAGISLVAQIPKPKK